MKTCRWMYLTVLAVMFSTLPTGELDGQDLSFLKVAFDLVVEASEAEYERSYQPRFINAESIQRTMETAGLLVPSRAEIDAAFHRPEIGQLVVDSAFVVHEWGPPDDPRLLAIAAQSGHPFHLSDRWRELEVVQWIRDDGMSLGVSQIGPNRGGGGYRVGVTSSVTGLMTISWGLEIVRRDGHWVPASQPQGGVRQPHSTTPAAGHDLTFMRAVADVAADFIERAHGVPYITLWYIDASRVQAVFEGAGLRVPSVDELRAALERDEPDEPRIIVVDSMGDAVERGPPDDPRLQRYAERVGWQRTPEISEGLAWIAGDGLVIRLARFDPRSEEEVFVVFSADVTLPNRSAVPYIGSVNAGAAFVKKDGEWVSAEGRNPR